MGVDPSTTHERPSAEIISAFCEKGIKLQVMTDDEAAQIKADIESGTVSEREVVETWQPRIDLAHSKQVATSGSRNEKLLDLWYAARDGDTARIQLQIDAGGDVNWSSIAFLGRPGGEAVRPGTTPLCEAAARDRRAAVELLLRSGAHVDGTSEDGWTPLHLVSEDGMLPMMRLLIDARADVNARNERGDTPLHVCAEGRATYDYGQVGDMPDAVKLLLQARASPTIASNNRPDLGTIGHTPLHTCCQRGYTTLIQLLLDADVDPRTPDAAGETPLFWACSYGQPAAVRALLATEHGVSTLNQADTQRGSTPLYIVSQNGHAACAELLICARVDVDLPNKGLSTPLFIACQFGHPRLVEILLAANASVDKERTNGFTPLGASCRYGNSRCTELLLEAHATIAMPRAYTGRSAILMAAAYGHLRCVQLLSCYGAALDECVDAVEESRGRLSLGMLGGAVFNDDGNAPRPTDESLRSTARWLREAVAWAFAPLHHLEVLSEGRACALLRDGSDVQLPAGRQTGCGMAGATLTDDGMMGRGVLSYASRADVRGRPGAAAARLILSAADPWSSTGAKANHRLFPEPARALAVELMWIGQHIGRSLRATDVPDSSSFVNDVWLEFIVPRALTRAVCWQSGCIVSVRGLAKRADLNGAIGELALEPPSYLKPAGDPKDPAQRWGVQIAGRAPVAIRRENLECRCARCLLRPAAALCIE
jgi:ankyrin repeat protein